MTTTADPAGRQGAPGERVVFVDVARSVAILGALAAHAVNTFAVWPALPPGWAKAVGNGLFYTCTPTFFLLFGVMLEWVYVRRRERDGAADAARRLAIRAGQCWLGLLLGMGCAWLSGRLSDGEMPSALLNLIDTPNSGILRFYTAAILLCIPVVLLRPWAGPRLPLLLLAAVWLGAALMPLLPWPGLDSPWAFLTGFLVAHPPAWTSGSLWHNLGIVFLGMALGQAMRHRLQAGLPPLGGRPLVLLLGACAIGTAAFAVRMGPLELLKEYLGTGRVLRASAHPAYFLIATASALVLIRLAQWRYPVGMPASAVRLPILALGRHSLLVFAVGNAALNLVPARLAIPPWYGAVATLAYLVAICVFARLVDRAAAPAQRPEG